MRAVQATQAAALALWVTLISWRHPQQAVMLAASLGGYAATTGALVGALVGALHGCSWVPGSWWQQLQDEPQQPGEQAGDAAAQHSDKHAEGGQAAAAAEQQDEASADGEEEGEEEEDAEDDDGEWQLRAFSKYSVVVLGHQLAQLDCRQPPVLL